MKLLTIVLSFVLWLHNYAKAQKLILPAASETTLKEEASDKTYYLHFKVEGRKPGENVTIHLKDFDRRSASLGKDYEYLVGDYKDRTLSDKTSDYFTVGIVVKADTVKNEQEYFDLQLSFLNDWAPSQTLTIQINDPKKSDIDTSKWSVRAITGSNFDFFDAPTFKNFAGELTVFVPGFTKAKVNKKEFLIGLQAGIFNYRYYDSDSSKGNIRSERYLTDPATSSIKPDTTKYIRDIYALNSTTNYNNWGVYLNPMLDLTKNDWYNLYFNLHLELIWRTQIFSYSKAPIRADTLTVSKRDIDSGIVLGAFPAIRSQYNKKTFFDSYLGIGFPLKVNIKNAFTFYINPTVGIVAFNTDEVKNSIINKIAYNLINQNTGIKPFILSKFQLTTTLAPVDIVLGGEIRKIYKTDIDNQRAYKALYLGAVIPLDKLKR